MKSINRVSMLFFFVLTLAAVQFWGSEVKAQSSYFASRCAACHGAPTVATCNGCHHHGNSSLSAATNKTSYAPGETVTATLSGGSRSGWIRAILYNQSNTQLAVSSGNTSGMGSSATFPAALTAPAPTTPGTYTWKMAYYGNTDGSGHSEVAVNTNSFTVIAAADTTAPVVGAFTLPATATSLIVPVSTLTASDDFAVTGYLITTSSAAPAASVAGWSATAPASVTAVAGSNTFYAWAKDAAGNVSLSRSASVTVTLPDTTAPAVGTFTIPATSSSLTVAVSASASDDVAVTGYMLSESAITPAAGATGWNVAAPASYTFATAGSKVLYVWAKDAAGNVSAVKSASVAVSLPDTTAPVVGTFTIPATSSSLTVAVSVSASDDSAVTGYMLSESATAPAAGATGWSVAAPVSYTFVTAGSKVLYVWAKDAAGNVSLTKSAVVTVTLPDPTDTTKPTLTVSTLADGAYTNMITLNVSGNASDAGVIQSVTVNGQAAIVNPDGSFSTALDLTAGANTITVIATDKAGNQTINTRTMTFDPNAPVITVDAPADNSNTALSFIIVSGTVSETSTVTATVNNGSPQSAILNGTGFSATVNLSPGINTIDITATDLAGNTTSAKRTVTSNSITNLALAVTYPAQDITTSKSNLILKGNVTGALGNATVSITMDGKTFTPSVNIGAFQQRLTFTTDKLYAITVTAADGAGNSSTVSRNVIYKTKK